VGKTKSQKNPQKGGRGRRRNRGGGQEAVWKDLAIQGNVPDMQLTVAQCAADRDIAAMGMPGRPANGPLHGYVEIFATMLVNQGISPDDAQKVLQMVQGTGKTHHWTEIPDLDTAAENRADRAVMAGGRVRASYDAAARLRRTVTSADKKRRARQKRAGW